MNAQVHISAAPHPFRQARVDLYAPEGLSIAQILALHGLSHEYGCTYVQVNDESVPQELWARVRPKACALLTVQIQPLGGGGGGGGKSPLKTILSIAVLAAGAFLGPALGATLFGAGGVGIGGLTISSATLGSALIGITGNLLINALAPPPRPKLSAFSSIGSAAKDSPTLFIEGARNDLRPFGVVPAPLGHHRFVPPLGAKSFTETIGDQQYVRQVFLWGYGPMDITHLEASLKIGDTPLSAFSDVEFETSYNEGAAPTLSLYPSAVHQVDLSIKLEQAGGYQLRTTETDTDEIIIDVTFPQGLVRFNDQGGKSTCTVQVEFQYAPAGTAIWTTIETRIFTRATSAAIRESVRKTVPRGQYDVRLRRITPNTDSTQIFDAVYWTALRSVTNENPIAEKNVVVTALRMRATDQLNGPVDMLSGEPKTLCPDWDGETGTWIPRATSNPASLYRWVLQGPANARPLPDSRIDLAALQDWHTFCEENDFTFNAVIDYEAAVRDVLSDVAAAGRASPTILDGQWSVVIDRLKTIPVQHFTPRNSWGYQGEKAFPDIAHAFRVQFLNAEKDWRQDERIVFDDGYDESNATKYETLELFGMTSADQVYKHAREHIATLRLRPEIHSFTVDVENLVATRGDLIKFTHDVPLFGLSSGRVKSVSDDGVNPANATHVTLDETLEMEAGKSYCLRFRLCDGTSLMKPVVTQGGSTKILAFQTPFALSEAPRAGDLFMFGESSKESVDLIIHSLEAGPDLTARLRCVDAAPGIFAASMGLIPPFESHITTPPEFTRPRAPIIQQIQTGEEVMVRNLDGSISTRMVITLENPNMGAVEPVVKIRQASETAYREADMLYRSSGKVALENLEDNQRYDFLIFYKRVGSAGGLHGNLMSAPTARNNVLFEGASAKPDDVQGFRLSVIGNAALLTWDSVRNIDFDYYEIRFSPEISGVLWGGAQVLYRDVRENRLMTPLQLGTYLVKAVDRSGLSSPNAALVSTTLAEITGLNVIETLTEDPAFTGVKTNCTIDTGQLVLADPALGTGTYVFGSSLDLGAVYTSRITPRIVARGKNTGNALALWGALGTLASLSGNVSPQDWSVTLQFRTTNDDPSLSPVWTSWEDLVIGDYTFRGIQFQIVITSAAANITPGISQLEVLVDMPDRILPLKDQNITAGGVRVAFTPAFKALKSVLVTAQSLSTGDVMQKTNEDETGVNLKFLNSAGVSVTRTVDLTAIGYGRQS